MENPKWKAGFFVTAVTWSTALYVAGQAIDLLSTYLLSPDLGRETNLMVRRFGFGWNYVLVSALVASVFMLLVQYWMWCRLCRHLPESRMSHRGSTGACFSAIAVERQVNSPSPNYRRFNGNRFRS